MPEESGAQPTPEERRPGAKSAVPEQRLIDAMRAANLSPTKAARALGIAQGTVSARWKRMRERGAVPADLMPKKRDGHTPGRPPSAAAPRQRSATVAERLRQLAGKLFAHGGMDDEAEEIRAIAKKLERP